MTAQAAIKKFTSLATGSASRLQGVSSLLYKVFTFSPADESILPKRNLSVCIEKGGVSIAYGSRIFSRTSINAVKEYFFTATKYPQPEELASSLTLTRNEFGSSTSDITLSIPKGWAIIKTAEFPLSVKENLAAVVGYELDRLTPFSAEEAYFDFRIIKETADKLTLLLMAAKAERIEPYLTALKENGFAVNMLTVNISGMCTLCRYAGTGADSVFVKIEEDGYEGALSLNCSPALAFSRTFSGEDDTAKAVSIAADIRRVAENSKDGNKVPVIAWFKDGNPVLKGAFKSQTDLPVKILGESDLKLGPGVKKGAPYAAVGSVIDSLWPKANSFNLLKKGITPKQQTPVWLTIILALAILATAALYAVQPLKIEERKLEQIDRQLAPKKAEVKKIEALKKEVEVLENDISTVRKFKESRPSTLDIVKQLTITIPKTTWLNRLRITETTAEIEGHSTSATELLPKLEASKILRKAEFASPTFRDARTGQERFNIRMEIEGSKKLEDMVKKETKKPDEQGAAKAAKPAGQAGKNEKK